MDKELFKAAIEGIIRQNIEHPEIPKNPKCNWCKLRDKAKCKIYPDGIPKEILFKENCDKFQEL